ncbi:hypothetical protein HIN51_24905, partial [Salmonella enterica subsp. enterica serovar Dublin]|nr:hypothetical protein [Salmonella enterica subsp. enterica serovar Dublin]
MRRQLAKRPRRRVQFHTQRLPLVAAQPGIWMAEKLSDLPSAWSVAHYVELNGELDAAL